MGTHYTVLVQIKEVTDATPVTTPVGTRTVVSQVEEKPRIVHDKVNLATTEATCNEAISTAINVLRLMLTEG